MLACAVTVAFHLGTSHLASPYPLLNSFGHFSHACSRHHQAPLGESHITLSSPFVFIFLRIALPATPLFSQPSALPRGEGDPRLKPSIISDVRADNSFVSYHIPPSPAFSCNYALFWATEHQQLFSFQSIAHSFYRHGGVPPTAFRCGSSAPCASRPTLRSHRGPSHFTAFTYDILLLPQVLTRRTSFSRGLAQGLHPTRLLPFTRHSRGTSAPAARMSYTIFLSGRSCRHDRRAN